MLGNPGEPAVEIGLPESVSHAWRVYRRCLVKLEEGSFHSLRDCLQFGQHAPMPGPNVK